MLYTTLGTSLGAGVGAATGYFGQCASGTCPLTSNWMVSAVIGALVGFFVVTSFVKR